MQHHGFQQNFGILLESCYASFCHPVAVHPGFYKACTLNPAFRPTKAEI
jgi:hypothetical protein